MKLFEKLQLIRVELQSQNIKKPGKNKFENYMYFELWDTLLSINKLEAKYKMCDIITYIFVIHFYVCYTIIVIVGIVR